MGRKVDELREDPNIHHTENVLLAAYVRHRGIRQVHIEKLKRGKGVFYFHMTPEAWNNIVSEYDNSPELKFEHCRVDTVNLTFT